MRDSRFTYKNVLGTEVLIIPFYVDITSLNSGAI
jgi:hypothetical protein